MSEYLDTVRRACLDACPGILMQWLPGGHIVGHCYQCANLRGGNGSSVKVNMAGSRPGAWGEWAGGDGQGQQTGGDLISLYAAVKSIPYKEALRELADQFSIPRPKRQPTREWEPIVPAPESCYTCDALGNPQLPEMSEQPSAWWPYFDAEGRLLNFRVRFERPGGNKDILPLSYCRSKKTGEFGWRMKDLPRPRPLYNLMGLASSPLQVLVVEGEKVTESLLRRLPGWCVVTWPGGVNNVHYADWSPLIGFEGRLVLWPDNDDPGRLAMADVARILGRECEVLSHDPNWPKGHDAADLDWDTAKLEAWINSAGARVEPEPPKSRPLVQLNGNDRFHHMQAIYSAMKESGADLYYTANGPVELKTDIYGKVTLNYLDAAGIRDWCSRNLDTRKHVSNELRWTEVAINLASALVFSGQEFLRPLWYVSHTPVMAPDGQMVEKSGYHPATKLYISVPRDYCECRDTKQAVEVIRDVLADFPHESEADLTHAVSFPMTCILRHNIANPTPLYRFEAPTPGSGKTLEGRVLFEVVTPNAEYLPAVEDNEEAIKVITAALLRMPAVIAFDNVSKFEAASLKQALTSGWWSCRILGQSKVISLPIWNAWACTVNNPEFSLEMLRRSVRVRLNAKVEHPELRPPSQFRHPDIVGYVRRYRSQILAAFARLCVQDALASTNGKPKGPQPYLGGYGEWCEALYPRLEAAGFHGFLSTYTQDLEKAASGQEQAVSTFIERWAEEYGTMQVSIESLCHIANGVDGLNLKTSKDGNVSKNSLGWLIRKQRDRVFGSFCVEPMTHERAGNTYRLSEILSGEKVVQKRDFETKTYF